jgi:hypothetical protein
MCVNEKRDLLKLFQQWGKWGIKENGGEGEFNYGIFDTVRTFINTTMYPQHNNKTNKEKKGC